MRIPCLRSSVVVLGLSWGVGCRPSDLLVVPPPSGIVASTAIQGRSEIEQVYAGAKTQTFGAIAANSGAIYYGSLLSDEASLVGPYAYGLNVDARFTAGSPQQFGEPSDLAINVLLFSRSELLQAIPLLRKVETGSRLSMVGEAYALTGYVELFMAEDFCAGVTLSVLLPGGGVAYGNPLTTDSLLKVAQAHFDSAINNANGNDSITSLAQVGSGRALLDLGQYAAAATAAGAVPIAFQYDAQADTNVGDNAVNGDDYWYDEHSGCGSYSVADRKGGNGIGFVSGHDPRMLIDSTLGPSCNNSLFSFGPAVWYYPLRFGNPATGLTPIASGIEAQLMVAEAALQANQPNIMGSVLRNLRTDTAATHVSFAVVDSLPTDSVEGASHEAQVDVMFRERAFWLYGQGTRLGDMRRLIRQYGRDQSTVYPVGPYPQGPLVASEYAPQGLILPNYGLDVSLTLPTVAGGDPITNPYYKGCIVPTTSA